MTSSPQIESKIVRWRRIKQASGFAVFLGIAASCSGTVVGMIRSFSSLAKADQPITDGTLSWWVESSFWLTMWLLPVIVAMVVVWVIATTRLRALRMSNVWEMDEIQ